VAVLPERVGRESRIEMFGRGRKHGANWAQVAAGAAALKVMPFKKTLLGIAAVAGAMYALKRLRR
jgi:hypothetical protein